MNSNRTLIGLNLAVFLMMLGVGMIMALLPQRIIDLTGSGATVGFLASAFAVSYILLQVPIGNLADRFGFRIFLAGGYLICFGTGLLYYFANHPSLFFLGRALQGAGEAPVWALAPAVLSIQYPAAKGKVIGMYNAAIHLGLTIGPLLGIFCAGRLQGNRPFLFYAAACLGGALVVACGAGKRGPAEAGPKPAMDFKGLIALATTHDSLIALIGIGLYGAGYGIFLTTIPAYLIGGKQFDPTAVGIFFALFYIAISIAQVSTGVLSDRLGRGRFMIIGLSVAAAGIWLFPGLARPWILIVLTVGGLGLGVFYLASMAFLNEIVPDALKGTISGAYYLFWGIGFCFGPALIGSSQSGLGFRVFAGLLLAEALVMLLGGRGQPKRIGPVAQT
jgi:MFS family permease